MNNASGMFKFYLEEQQSNSCYEMTFFKRKSQRNLTYQIVQDTEWHLRETKTIQIPALATLLYVDWVPQDNGSPPALPSIVVDHL